MGQRFFAGTFTHTIDGQNRITIPSIWRGSKGSGEQDFFIVPHPDKSLWVLTPAELLKLQERISNTGMAARDTWNMLRVFAGKMQQASLDSQGRLTIGDELLKFAELESGKDAVLVGLVKHFEIVRPDRWKEWSEKAEANYGEIAARVGL